MLICDIVSESEIEYIKLEALKAGSMRAFEDLYNSYVGRLYSFLLRISNGDRYMTEEVVQQTFIKVWEKHETIDVEKSFLNFLCTIAKNIMLNSYEHETLGFLYSEYVQALKSETDETTERQVEFSLLEQYIDSVVQKLPPARREIFILSRKMDYSNKMIAAKLNISESTIEKQLSKATEFVRAQLLLHYDKIFILLFCWLM